MAVSQWRADHPEVDKSGMTSIYPLYSHEYYHPVHNRQIQHHMIQRKQEDVLGDCVPHLFSLDGLFQGGGANMDYHIYVVYMYVHVSYMYCIFPTFPANVFNPYSCMTKSEVKD